MKVYLFRHGETLWSKTGQHTGLTDLDLTPEGELEAKKLGESVKNISFDYVFASPLKRVLKTCDLVGLKENAVIEPKLLEWDYGDYEGLTSKEIWNQDPGWTIFKKDPPDGETSFDVQARADYIIHKISSLDGNIAIFSSGHFSRVIAARFLGLDISFGASLILSTASKSILGYEHNVPAIFLWNDTSHLI
jgi:broad specificity phosphatase PhoE